MRDRSQGTSLRGRVCLSHIRSSGKEVYLQVYPPRSRGRRTSPMWSPLGISFPNPEHLAAPSAVLKEILRHGRDKYIYLPHRSTSTKPRSFYAESEALWRGALESWQHLRYSSRRNDVFRTWIGRHRRRPLSKKLHLLLAMIGGEHPRPTHSPR